MKVTNCVISVCAALLCACSIFSVTDSTRAHVLGGAEHGSAIHSTETEKEQGFALRVDGRLAKRGSAVCTSETEKEQGVALCINESLAKRGSTANFNETEQGSAMNFDESLTKQGSAIRTAETRKRYGFEIHSAETEKWKGSALRADERMIVRGTVRKAKVGNLEKYSAPIYCGREKSSVGVIRVKSGERTRKAFCDGKRIKDKARRNAGSLQTAEKPQTVGANAAEKGFRAANIAKTKSAADFAKTKTLRRNTGSLWAAEKLQTVGANVNEENYMAAEAGGIETGGRETGGAALQRYSTRGDVTHFFTHALVAHPEIGFASGNEMSVNYDRDCLTPQEFKAILESLYERGYALADIYSTFKADGGGVKRTAFDFPADKKPLILSFDDINYYVKKMDMGMNDRLDLDENGRFFTYTERAEQKISYDNEVVTILENFIARHPDFSYNGARGVLCLTGFDGVLGYRTQSGSPARKEETVKAKRVADALKAAGWRFACHSYGHYHMKKLSAERFEADTLKWISEVCPVTGKTELYVYPYGEWEVKGENGGDCAKHAFLKSQGFKLFCGVGELEYFSPVDSGALFMDRKPLDGISLRKLQSVYSPFFDAAAVYDSRRPTPYPAS